MKKLSSDLQLIQSVLLNINAFEKIPNFIWNKKKLQ